MTYELRKLIFMVCVAVGGMVGLSNAQKDLPPPRTCQPPTPECVAQSTMDAPTHQISSVIAGMLVGGAVGFGLALLVRPRRESPSYGSVSAQVGAGRWITARYPGRCRHCRQTVYPGDRVLHFRAERKVACRACGGG